MTLMTLDYGNYGIFLIMDNEGFMSSAVEASPPGLPQVLALQAPAPKP